MSCNTNNYSLTSESEHFFYRQDALDILKGKQGIDVTGRRYIVSTPGASLEDGDTLPFDQDIMNY